MTTLAPNMRETYAVTAGIARDMQRDIDMRGNPMPLDTATPQGGGDLNGTTASFFLHQAGTTGAQWSVARLPGSATLNTGIGN
jgi:hypothetical protein